MRYDRWLAEIGPRTLWLSANTLYGAEAAALQLAVAVLHPTAGQHCQGLVRFTQEGPSVKVVADLEGLTPGQKHAFHIHQYGDCSSPLKKVGHAFRLSPEWPQSIGPL